MIFAYGIFNETVSTLKWKLIWKENERALWTLGTESRKNIFISKRGAGHVGVICDV